MYKSSAVQQCTSCIHKLQPKFCKTSITFNLPSASRAQRFSVCCTHCPSIDWSMCPLPDTSMLCLCHGDNRGRPISTDMYTKQGPDYLNGYKQFTVLLKLQPVDADFSLKQEMEPTIYTATIPATTGASSAACYFRFLPQAGDGADYLDGYKDSKHGCFKCGRPGHWAHECQGLLPNGQVKPQQR